MKCGKAAVFVDFNYNKIELDYILITVVISKKVVDVLFYL